jgi:hypothetical protein
MTASRFVIAITLTLGIFFVVSSAEPQSGAHVPRVGYLGNSLQQGPDACPGGLRALGWIESQNVIIERRYIEGNIVRRFRSGWDGLCREPGATRRKHPLNYATASEEQLATAAQMLKIELHRLEIRSADDIETTMTAGNLRGLDAVFVVGDPLTFRYRKRIHELAALQKVPTFVPTPEYVEGLALMAYGPSLRDASGRSDYSEVDVQRIKRTDGCGE